MADITTIFQGKNEQTLEIKHPAQLNDIIDVNKSSKRKHMDEVRDVLTKLKNAGYKLSENKSELFRTKIECSGHYSA